MWFLNVTVFLAGAAVLIIEILGTRIIGPFYGSTIYVWTALIVVTLGALASGYLVGGRLADKWPNKTLLSISIFLAGLAISLILKIDQPVLLATEQFGFQGGPLVASLALFALPLLLLGTVSPFAIRMISSDLMHSGRTAGRVFALGTLGSIAGALLAGFVFAPYLALSSTMLIISVTLCVLGITGALLAGKWLMAVVLVGLSVATLYLPTYTYHDTKYTMQVIHRQPSFRGNIKVIDVAGMRCITVDGTMQSCELMTGDKHHQPGFVYTYEVQRIVESLQHVDNVLVLGLGGGTILRVLPPDSDVDAIEIDPTMVALGQQFFDVQPSAHQKIIIDDARAYLRSTNKQYDLIIVDAFAGNTIPAHLITKEFYSLLSTHLHRNGLALVNMSGEPTGDNVYTASMIKTMESVFPTVYASAYDTGQLTEMLVHLSLKPHYSPRLSGDFSEVVIQTEDGILLSDNTVPLEHITKDYSIALRKQYYTIGGPRMFFVE